MRLYIIYIFIYIYINWHTTLHQRLKTKPNPLQAKEPKSRSSPISCRAIMSIPDSSNVSSPGSCSTADSYHWSWRIAFRGCWSRSYWMSIDRIVLNYCYSNSYFYVALLLWQVTYRIVVDVSIFIYDIWYLFVTKYNYIVFCIHMNTKYNQLVLLLVNLVISSPSIIITDKYFETLILL